MNLGDTEPLPEPSTRKPAAVANLAIGFILLVCALFIIVDLVQLGVARREQLADTTVALTNMARSLQRHADDTLKSADVSLIGMVKLMENEGYTLSGRERLASLMGQSATALGQIHAYFAFDEYGHSVIDSTPLYAQLDVSEREYFRFHRDNTSREAHVGPLIKSSTTNTWIITVSRRVNHDDGSFAGVIMAALELEYFRMFYDTFDIGKKGVIFLGTNPGTTLVRRPLYEKYVGRSMVDLPIYREHIALNNAGMLTMKSAVDGEVRLTAYEHLQNYPLFVFVALSRDEVLAGWVSDTIVHACGIGILVLTLAFIGWRLVRQIRLRAKTEISLREARDSLNELNATLQRLALEDGLTGLANRRHFDLALQEELSRATRNASSLALILIDVDRFKQYNDLYGHAAGDECLRKIGRAVKAVPRRRSGRALRRRRTGGAAARRGCGDGAGDRRRTAPQDRRAQHHARRQSDRQRHRQRRHRCAHAGARRRRARDADPASRPGLVPGQEPGTQPRLRCKRACLKKNGIYCAARIRALKQDWMRVS